MNNTPPHFSPKTIGLYLALPADISRELFGVTRLEHLFLNRLVESSLRAESLLLDQHDPRPVTMASFQNKIMALADVTSQASAAEVLNKCLAEIDLIERVEIGWYHAAEATWVNVYPKDPAIPFRDRVQDLGTWEEREAQQKAQLRRMAELVRSMIPPKP